MIRVSARDTFGVYGDTIDTIVKGLETDSINIASRAMLLVLRPLIIFDMKEELLEPMTLTTWNR